MNMPLTGVNWASRPTVKLVTDINGGPGPASSIEAGAAGRALSAVLSEADDDFTSATKLAMGNWEGPAADSARTALMPFSEWATAAGTIAH
jgi:PPE-repeat protein